jgi:hypothetical protein
LYLREKQELWTRAWSQKMKLKGQIKKNYSGGSRFYFILLTKSINIIKEGLEKKNIYIFPGPACPLPPRSLAMGNCMSSDHVIKH